MSGAEGHALVSLWVMAGAPAPGTPADAADRFAGAQALLERCGLPRLLPEDHPGHYLILCDGETVVGCAGWEPCGHDALLRSVAVAPERRGQGTGERLVRAALVRLRAAGVARAWLLTETAAPFFARLGFRPAPRTAAPEAVRVSRQFSGACCATAACLHLWITPPHPGDADHP